LSRWPIDRSAASFHHAGANEQPGTLGQALRISGVSTSDIGILMVWLKQGAPANGERNAA
jgi:tRNA U34 5-carboxymethylaminomethyl modifying enzyme MnmG/GidA